tara:strand:- start:1241 stop:1396 length:156 start_codon:yes stop_codon:yes gene_type:complete
MAKKKFIDVYTAKYPSLKQALMDRPGEITNLDELRKLRKEVRKQRELCTGT